jgi:hypothetical protein
MYLHRLCTAVQGDCIHRLDTSAPRNNFRLVYDTGNDVRQILLIPSAGLTRQAH